MTSWVVPLNAGLEVSIVDAQLSPRERPGRIKLTEDDRVGWEDGKVGVQFEEEVKLISGAPNAVGKEECVPLEPLHRLGRILETDAGTAHFDVSENGY